MTASELAARLPDVPTVQKWSRSLAVLDAILSPEWEYRYFSYDPRWDEQEHLASMRNGSGDEYSIVFSPVGAYVRGFDHESGLSPWRNTPKALTPGLVDDVPESMRVHLDEPAFSADGVPQITVCLWREASDSAWSFGTPNDQALRDVSDGADELFEQLDGSARTYVEFAEEYFERTLHPADVDHVLRGRPLDADVIVHLNPDVQPSVVLAEAGSMGYPVDASPSSEAGR